MLRSSTSAFIWCLVAGLLPGLSSFIPSDVEFPHVGPVQHAVVSFLSICVYAGVIYRILGSRELRGGEMGSELSDSVYFLGFLQTMGVLAASFVDVRSLGSGEAITAQLFTSVAASVGLTLVGLAFRVFLTLKFGSSADSSSTPGSTGSAWVMPSGAPGPGFTAPQIELVNESLSRIETAAKGIAEKVKAISMKVTESIAVIDAFQNDFELKARRMIGEADHVSAAVEASAERMKKSMEASFQNASKAMSESASKFSTSFDEAHESLASSLQVAKDRHAEIGRVIEADLAQARSTTGAIAELSKTELASLSAIAARITTLSTEITTAIASIPNPTTTVVQGLNDLTSAVERTALALQQASSASDTTASSLQFVSSAAEQVPAALRELPESVQDATRHLQAELKTINQLLDEFAALSKRRLEGERR